MTENECRYYIWLDMMGMNETLDIIGAPSQAEISIYRMEYAIVSIRRKFTSSFALTPEQLGY